MSHLFRSFLLYGLIFFAQGNVMSQTGGSTSIADIESLLKEADGLRFKSTSEVHDLANEALNLAVTVGYGKGRAHAHALNAWVFRIWGFNGKATENALLAIDLSREGGHTAEELEGTLQLGMILKDRDIYPSADSIFELGLDLAYELQDTFYMAYFLNGRGECDRLSGKFDDAYKKYEQVLQWHEGVENELGVSSAWNNLGLIHLAKKEYEEAIALLNKSLALGKEIKFVGLIMESSDALSQAYLKTGRIDEAEQIALENLSYAKENSYKKYMAFSYQSLTDLYVFKGDFEKAFLYQGEFLKVSDELKSDELEQFIAGLEYDQEISRKESELVNLRRNRTRQRIVMFSFVLGFLLVSIMAIVLYRSRKKAKSMNDKLSLQFSELERIQREKDSLLHIVAHDLKSPLIKIEGLVEMIKGSAELHPQQDKSLGFIRQITADGRHLIQDLLDIHQAEGEEGLVQKENFELVSTLDHLAQSYSKRSQDKNIAFQFEGMGTEVLCNSDRIAVIRIVDNLLSNAIKYSPPGKRVWLKVWQDGKQALIEIQDEGPGFSEADQKRMYQKFQMLTARPTGGESSNGLGLAIVKSLLNRLQGKVELVSEEGKGASFTVSFPRNL